MLTTLENQCFIRFKRNLSFYVCFVVGAQSKKNSFKFYRICVPIRPLWIHSVHSDYCDTVTVQIDFSSFFGVVVIKYASSKSTSNPLCFQCNGKKLFAFCRTYLHISEAFDVWHLTQFHFVNLRQTENF